MKICLFTPNFYPTVGGAEKDADLVATGLTERGHELVVLTQHPKKPGGSMPELSYRVERYRRPFKQNLWPEVLRLPLARSHRRHRFDAVLAFYSYPTGYAAALMKGRLRVGVVLCPQGGDLYPQFHGLNKFRVAGVIRAGYRRADRIVSISHWLTRRLREVCGEPLPPIDTVYNGIDLTEHDRLRDESRAHPPNIPIDRPYVLHLARVAPVKQQTLAVRAVHELGELFERRRLSYAIVGAGNGVDEVRALIDRLDVGHLVRMLGTRSGVEKAWLYDNAEFMVSTSREEAFGNVVIESMASGLPMLASDAGAHPELVGELGWGTLFRSGDLSHLVTRLREMIGQDKSSLAARALACRDRFTIDKMIDGYERACESSIK